MLGLLQESTMCLNFETSAEYWFSQEMIICVLSDVYSTKNKRELGVRRLDGHGLVCTFGADQLV